MPKNNLLENLNQKQQEAVKIIQGPVLILAGPGSGKTRVLTHRIAYLIEQGVSPRNILALTFTNKAAEEMRQRVQELLKDSCQGTPLVGTFHSVCAKWLRSEIKAVGLKSNFVIYDAQDSRGLLKRVMKELQVAEGQFKPELVKEVISRAKNELVDNELYAQQAFDFFPQIVSQIYTRYQQRLKEANALDFDDLLLLMVKIFQQDPATLKKYQNFYKYILVDEYQDTNHAQYVFINLLAKKEKNLFVIGDEAQCLPAGTKISTENGEKNIERIKAGEEIIAACGFGEKKKCLVKKVYQRKSKEKIIKIITGENKPLSVSKNHLVFAKTDPRTGFFYVYLMFRKNFGFRIGYTSSTRKNKNGLAVRTNQERADKSWILKTCATKNQAVFWEQYFAFKYGIPTTVYFDKGRNIKLNQKQIDKIFGTIDTEKRAQKLMQAEGLFFDFPHYRAQAVCRKYGSKQKNRAHININFFAEKQKNKDWHGHRLSLITSDQQIKNLVEKDGFSVRSGKRSSKKEWRVETSRKKYQDAVFFAEKLSAITGFEIIKKAKITKSRSSFFLLPACSLRPSMTLATIKKGRIKQCLIKKIKQVEHKGILYDLDVETCHNYFANDIAVHNSIYGWRGADWRNILNFESDYPEAKVILLEQNYRSTQQILDAAHNVISHARQKKEKNLWTEKKEGQPLVLFEAANQQEEGFFVVEQITKIKQGEGLNYRDFAVLYRTNAQSRSVEEAFLQAGLPYKIIGGFKFYERKEIKDVLAYLRYLQNEKDHLSFERIVNTPPRGVGEKTLEKIKNNNWDFNLEIPALQDFKKIIIQLKEASRRQKLSALIKLVLEKTGLKKYLLDGTEEGLTRFENVQELLTVAKKYDSAKPPQGLELFLEEISLLTDQDEIEDKKDQVNLMTLHCAKGLEFPVVFIAGCEEGLFPHSRSLDDPSQMEEERRLCYVGITRAKKHLHLIFANQRQLYGSIQVNPPSRFLNDIPEKLLEKKTGQLAKKNWFFDDDLDEDEVDIIEWD